MEQEKTNGEIFCQTYGADIEKLARYIPWLTEKSGKEVSRKYDGEFGESAIHFPVYDGTLLNFVKEAKTTSLIDRNYPYAYSGRRIRTPEDEKREISSATLREVDILRGIFSKYVLEGMTKSGRWSEAVNRGIFLDILCKLKEIADFYKN